VEGLTNGDTYTFTVTATNSVGTGPASSASNPITPGFQIVIDSITPSQVAQTAKTTVTITGSGFTGTPTVKISGNGLTVALESATSTAATVKITVAASAAPGQRDVSMTDNGSSTTCTGCLTVTSRSTVTSATPSEISTGATGPITFAGTGFEAGATVKISGPSTGITVSKSTIVVTATTVTGTVKVPSTASTGTYTVTVVNPDGSSAGCTNCLQVIAAPTITGINPSSAARRTTVSVTVTGTGFAAGAILQGPSGVTFSNITVVNSTTITATMKVASAAPLGSNLGVKAINPAAGGYGTATANVLTVT
jgi:hypothetical protein